MTIKIEEAVLDDVEAMQAADADQMLRAVASSGAQVRQAAIAAEEAGLARLREEGQPRTVVVAGLGGSGISGDVLAAVAGIGCRVPVVTLRDYTLPGWVGPMDLLIGVSCSGATEETLAVVEEAARRGTRLVTVGAPKSPLAGLSEQARGIHVPVDSGGRLPRANIWALSVPLLVAAHALGLASVPREVLDRTADLLDDIAQRCRPTSEAFVNPAKELALAVAGSVPMLWGSSPLAGVAAYRFACQLNENTKYPAVFGTLPEANHNQIMAFEGALAASSNVDEDLFRDRVGDEIEPRIRLVLLRDTVEHPQVTRRREVSQELAEARGIPVSEVVAEGAHPLERLASLVALTDYASVYAAFVLGVDPSPVASIFELKERIAR
ncbi:SIS domain-containing protein [Carbonactinospora thermoautotrophica]|uniref:SIS domain-containing protein n=1 Tax=Carbonactinospora thermoautotrophica TaxID=1469144 RepID=UPI003DA9F8AC